MKTLFDRSHAAEISLRIDSIQADTARLWGKMTARQAKADVTGDRHLR